MQVIFRKKRYNYVVNSDVLYHTFENQIVKSGNIAAKNATWLRFITVKGYVKVEKYLLDGNWSLVIAENRKIKKDGFAPKSIDELENCEYTKIVGTVPGNFELDMVREGLLEEPYFGTNVLKTQELENRHLWYYRRFDCDFSDNADCSLKFDGIDTVAEIYLNGHLIGKTENMFIGYEFDVSDLKAKDNELVVHILPITIYSRDFEITPLSNALPYNYESLYIRKAPHMYGWDIMPRIVSAGIWKSVYLINKKPEYIEDCYLYTNAIQPKYNKASIRVFFSVKSDRDFLKGLRITVDGVCRDSSFSFESDVWHSYGYFGCWQENIYYWWPINYGEPNLYDVSVKLWRDGEVIDEKNFKFGVRTVELERTSTTKALGDGKFVFKINQKPVYVLGTNWVPLDAFHSNDINRVDKAIDMLCECGCNTARIWGGGVYESDRFYELCDQKGIMVWQDFMMACAVYPQEDEFLEMIRREATSVVKRLRNHASLILWSGDNECDLTYSYNGIYRDPNRNLITRKILPEVIERHDMVRPYLPSSPYVDEEAFRTKLPIPEDHPWGPRNYFKSDYYKNIICCFASEIGYHGCPSPESLEKFISEDKLWPIMKNDVTANDDWHVHAANMEIKENTKYAYRINLMNKQIAAVFTEKPDNLEDFAKMSQIIQAEAKKYFIESFRIAKGKTTGIIWWNLLDGWPQISDAVVDYYYTPKLAYHYITRSQNPVCLMFAEPENGKLKLFAVNELSEEKKVTYKVINLADDRTVCEGECTAEADASVEIAEVAVPENASFYFIEWFIDGIRYTNHFMTETQNISYANYLKAIEKCGYNEFSGF